jgi:uncharacterized protein
MAFASFSPSEMRPTALLLNIIAASYSTWRFNRGRLVDWARLMPLLLASLPTAFVGGFIILDEHIYRTVRGIVLLFAAAILASRSGLLNSSVLAVPKNNCSARNWKRVTSGNLQTG